MKKQPPLRPFIEADHLLGKLAAMCMPDPVVVLFADGVIDFDALPDSTPQWLPYKGPKIENLLDALRESGHAELGHAVSMASDKMTTMSQAARLTRKGREAVRDHEALLRAGRKLEAIEICARMFGFKEATIEPARAVLRKAAEAA